MTFPLHIACKNEEYTQVASLLNDGADVNARNIDNRTPFQMTYFKADKTMATFLALRGADVNILNKHGATLLHECCSCGNINGIKYLLSVGAYANAKDYKGLTPLAYARATDQIAVINFLQEHNKTQDREIPHHDSATASNFLPVHSTSSRLHA